MKLSVNRKSKSRKSLKRKSVKRKLLKKRSIRRKSKSLIGGEIIGTGTTANVIYPALPCNSAHQSGSNIVTKLFFKKSDMVKELNLNLLNKLREIDPNQERFVYALDNSNCGNHSIPIESIDDIRETFPLQNISNTQQLSYFNMIRTVPIQNFYSLSEQRKEFVKQSLTILHNHGISHNDIHAQNVMISHDDGNLRIIDFGESAFLQYNVEGEDLFKLDNDKLNSLFNSPPEISRSRKKKPYRSRSRSRSRSPPRAMFRDFQNNENVKPFAFD